MILTRKWRNKYSMDLEILNREFIVIDGEEYPCCVKGSADGDYWYE